MADIFDGVAVGRNRQLRGLGELGVGVRLADASTRPSAALEVILAVMVVF